MICPKHDTGGGPCYCEPPRRKITLHLKNGARAQGEFTSVESMLSQLGINESEVLSINSVRRGKS